MASTTKMASVFGDGRGHGAHIVRRAGGGFRSLYENALGGGFGGERGFHLLGRHHIAVRAR